MKQSLLILFSLLILACDGPGKTQFYELGNPVTLHKLDRKLNEISGLQVISDSLILEIQDEKAIVYYLNLKGEIIKRILYIRLRKKIQ